MFIVRTNDNKCPICKKNLNIKDFGNEENYQVCPNKCFRLEHAYGAYAIFIFNDEYFYGYKTPAEELKIIFNKVNDKIEYWKENDRYLMEILTN